MVRKFCCQFLTDNLRSNGESGLDPRCGDLQGIPFYLANVDGICWDIGILRSISKHPSPGECLTNIPSPD